MKTNSKQILTIFVAAAAGIWAYIFFAEPWGPGANGLWLRADHNHDGIITRDEMDLFGSQAPHRDGARLLMHFDAADSNHDKQVDQAEIDVYGVGLGSQDPANRNR